MSALRELIARFKVSVEGLAQLKQVNPALTTVARSARETATTLGGRLTAGMRAVGDAANAARRSLSGAVSQGLEPFRVSAAGMSGQLAAMAGVGGIGLLVGQTIAETNELSRLALVLGTTGKEADAYAQVLGGVGLGLQDLQSSMGQLASVMSDTGSASVEAFDAVGVSVRDASGALRTPLEVLPEIGAALAALPSATERLALAQRFFGEDDAAKLLPILGSLNEELDKARQSSGLADAAPAARQAGIALNRLAFAWRSLRGAILVYAAPALETVSDALAVAAEALASAARHSNILGAAAITLGGVIVAANAAAVASFLPYALAVAAVILILDDLLTWWQGGESAFGKALDATFGPSASDKLRGYLGVLSSDLAAFWADATAGGSSFGDALSGVVAVFITAWTAGMASVEAAIVGGFASAADAALSAIAPVIGAIDSLVNAAGGVGNGLTGLEATRAAVAQGAADARAGGQALVARARAVELDIASRGALGRAAAAAGAGLPSVNVTVNAPGATNPAAVGRAAAQGTRQGLEGSYRAARAAVQRRAP